jgi:hypothetical protein
MDIISRDEAQAKGRTHYFTGVPCRRGHVCARFTTNGNCTQCQNRRLMPSGSAPNVGMPPSPYAFHSSTKVTPALLSYVHGRALAMCDRWAADYEWSRLVLTGAPAHADRLLEEYRAQGWTPQQLVDAGHATRREERPA